MNVLITDPAKNQLKKIYHYFRRKGNGKKGREIRKSVLEKAKLLRDNPFLGQVEEELASMGLGHRYLVVKPNYKIIYLVAEPTIFITDIFDTRQDPTKMQP